MKNQVCLIEWLAISEKWFLIWTAMSVFYFDAMEFAF